MMTALDLRLRNGKEFANLMRISLATSEIFSDFSSSAISCLLLSVSSEIFHILTARSLEADSTTAGISTIPQTLSPQGIRRVMGLTLLQLRLAEVWMEQVTMA